jgi:hypothetical protein
LFPPQNPVFLFSCPLKRYMLHPSHSVWLEEYITWSSSLCSFLQSPVTSSLTVQNIFLRFPLSVTQVISNDLTQSQAPAIFHNMFMVCSKELLATVGCLWLVIECICGAYIHTVTHIRVCVCVCVGRGMGCAYAIWGLHIWVLNITRNFKRIQQQTFCCWEVGSDFTVLKEHG